MHSPAAGPAAPDSNGLWTIVFLAPYINEGINNHSDVRSNLPHHVISMCIASFTYSIPFNLFPSYLFHDSQVREGKELSFSYSRIWISCSGISLSFQSITWLIIATNKLMDHSFDAGLEMVPPNQRPFHNNFIALHAATSNPDSSYIVERHTLTRYTSHDYLFFFFSPSLTD